LLRSRVWYTVLALGTIALGLGVHSYGDALGPRSRDVIGDALWAAMIVWWLAVLVPAAAIRVRGFAALMICFAVEVSQLYHTPALDALRRTRLGALTLGSGFDSRDFFAYALGVLAATVSEWIILGWRRRKAHRAAI
jgi:hypothetical protein